MKERCARAAGDYDVKVVVVNGRIVVVATQNAERYVVRSLFVREFHEEILRHVFERRP